MNAAKRTLVTITSDQAFGERVIETAFLYLHDTHEQVSYRKEMFAKQYT